jgi:hypothetical protein
MRRFVMVTVFVVAVALVTGVAIAQMERAPMSPMAGGMGSGMMGHMMGAAGCPGMGSTPASLTEEKAKEAAQAYADKHLKGFTVEKVLPFTGPHGTMYSVEMKGSNEELRTFHVNPWGNVMPFGGPGRRAG